MDSMHVNSLKADSTYTGNIMIDSTFILLPASAVLTESMLKAVADWGFTEVTCEGEISLDNPINTAPQPSQPDTQFQTQNPAEKFNESVKKAFESTKKGITNTDRSRMEVVTTYYNEYMNFITSVFTHYTTHGEINQKGLSETVQNLCVFIKENRRYILRVNPAYDENAKSYLINHTMRSTVIAIAIALQLHMPLSQMIDLGVSCILHEIGMLSLPPQLYMTQRRLTPGERKKIRTHSVEGLKIVQKLEFSAPIQMGVLQHHEKENGTGYPQGLSGEKITNIAKIISVACSFEAITSPRKYKTEKTSFDAMLEMLKNENHPYDENIIKALLYTVSLFPIGAYVYLRSGKIGIVIDVNPENPKCPVVQLLLEKEKDGSPKTIQSDNAQNQIIRVLSIKEQQDVIKAVKETERKQEEAIIAEQKKKEKIEELKEQSDSTTDSELNNSSEASSSNANNIDGVNTTDNVTDIEDVDMSLFD